jgi:hypothetical protein
MQAAQWQQSMAMAGNPVAARAYLDEIDNQAKRYAADREFDIANARIRADQEDKDSFDAHVKRQALLQQLRPTAASIQDSYDKNLARIKQEKPGIGVDEAHAEALKRTQIEHEQNSSAYNSIIQHPDAKRYGVGALPPVSVNGVEGSIKREPVIPTEDSPARRIDKEVPVAEVEGFIQKFEVENGRLPTHDEVKNYFESDSGGKRILPQGASWDEFVYGNRGSSSAWAKEHRDKLGNKTTPEQFAEKKKKAQDDRNRGYRWQ